MTFDEIKKELEIKLNQKRFAHCMGVAQTGEKLAEIYDANPKKAYLAGVLHDCAKNYTDEKMHEKVKCYGIELDDVLKKSPHLVHAFVGAEEARRIYGIDDSEIYDAIYRHSLGGANMALLTKIIYLSDGIEPSRDYCGVEKIRETALFDIDKAVLMYTDATIEFVIKSGRLLHPSAVETRNFYLDK